MLARALVSALYEPKSGTQYTIHNTQYSESPLHSVAQSAVSDPPPHWRRRARYQSGSSLALVLDSQAIFGSLYPPIIPPGTLHIPPGRPTSTSSGSLFRIQNRIQNFIDFLMPFWLPKCSKKPPKIRSEPEAPGRVGGVLAVCLFWFVLLFFVGCCSGVFLLFSSNPGRQSCPI